MSNARQFQLFFRYFNLERFAHEAFDFFWLTVYNIKLVTLHDDETRRQNVAIKYS